VLTPTRTWGRVQFIRNNPNGKDHHDMNDTRFTEYGGQTAGLGYHTITADRVADGWTLTLRFTSWAGGDAQDIASDTVAPEEIRYPSGAVVPVRPSRGANALAHRILGTAWSALDKGRGYSVELALR
jgi:hypothetical protein